MGMQNGTAMLEDSSAVSFKTKHTVKIWSSNCTPWNLPKWTEKLDTHKHLIAKTWKQPRCSPIGEWLNRLWYIPAV